MKSTYEGFVGLGWGPIHSLAGSLHLGPDAEATESVRKQAAPGTHIVCPAHRPVVKDATVKFPEV